MKLKSDFKLTLAMILSICLFVTNFSTNIFLDVSAEDYVAKVNENNYTSIESAVNSIEDEGTVEVIANTSLDKQITIDAGKNVTIKGGDYTIELASSSTAFKIEKEGSLTIDGNLTFTTKDENTSTRGFVNCSGTFKFNNGTIDMKNGNLGSGSLINVTGPEAEFILNNGIIKNVKNGGGVYVNNQASFIMNDGTISNCSAYLYGGGVLVEGQSKDSSAAFTMNGGVIEKCQALYGGGVCIRCYSNDGKAEMIMNGGTIRDNIAGDDKGYQTGAGGGIMIWDNIDRQNVYSSEHISLIMKNGEISNNSVPNGMGGGVACCGGKFTMEGGSINNNKASSSVNGCGGGVYIASSGVTLNRGKIQNNEAGLQGGGVYCGSIPYIVKVYNAVIKENRASIIGGGVWACPTGDVKVFITNGVAVYDNTAEKAGDDVASIKNTNNEDYVLTLSDRMLGGGQVLWYLDGKLNTTQKDDKSDNRLGVADESVQRYPNTDPDPITNINDATDSYVLKAVASDSAKSLAMSTASLLITGNSAPRGGGIGTNGGFIMGDENNDYSLIVKKIWENTTDESLKKELTVYLKINETELDSVKLNSNNNWTATFDDLPSPDSLDNVSYAVVEDPVPDNFVPSYSKAEVDHDTKTIEIDIMNTYSPPLGNLTISKTVKGDVPNYQKEFKFRVTFTDEDGNPIKQEFNYTGSKEGTIKNGGTITLKHDESITINDLPAGTKYTVTEVDIPDGYTPDKPEQSGVIVGNEEAVLKYINNYKATPITYTPKAIKTLIGAIPSSEGTFSFSIKEKADNPENGAVLPEDATATVTGEGTARFGAITFNKAGEYKFEIREIKGDEAGYTYDESLWTLTVKVADNDSHLKVESYSYTKAGGITNEDGAAFTNRYNVTKAEYAPKVTKMITGTTPANNKSFTFSITAKPNNPSGAKLPENTTATVTGAGSTNFNAITFSKAGTYNFEIKETKGNDEGYTYDESVWTLKVVVTDENSQLKVSSTEYSKIGAQSATEAVFTNIYTVKSTEYQPKVKKTVTGDPSKEKTFTFSITAKADNPNGANLPTNTEAKVTGSGTANFGNINFTKAGTYNFEIKETQENEPGYSYDGSVWTLTVEVTDDNSQLKASSAEYSKSGAKSTENAEFENSYSITEVSYSPQVEKTVTGDTPSDKTFTFNIEASEDNPNGAEMPEEKTATVKGAGSANFGDITFTKAGTYTFKISEAKGNDAGYTYDESVWTLKVVVEDTDSALTVKSHTYEKADRTSSGERALFTNTYSAEPTEYAPQAEKTVTGKTPSDETFTFIIKASADNPENGAVLPKETTASVTGSGSTKFKAITFTKAGTYTFEISEEKGTASGYTYDESVWTLTVEVVDNESKLEVQSHTYTKTDGTTNEEKSEFENIYKPTEPKTDPTTEPTTPTSPTDPTTPTEPTNTTNSTNPTEPTTKKLVKEKKKTTKSKKSKSTESKSSQNTNNPPYSKTKNPTNNNTNGGNNGNTPNAGSESERNLPLAFLVTFLLGLNTVYFSFRKRRLKGRKAK